MANKEKCNYRLTYFDAMGKGEAIRQLFIAMDVPFEDNRIEFENWPSMKPEMPFGQIPTLEIDGHPMAQSIALMRYLAKKHGQEMGLAGKDLLEETKIEQVAFSLQDFRYPFTLIVLEKDPEIKEQRKQLYEETTLPTWLSHFEKNLIQNNGGNGYFVGDCMTWADIMFCTYMNSAPFKFAGIKFDLKPYPKLRALIKRVESHPKLKKWISERPVTKL